MQDMWQCVRTHGQADTELLVRTSAVGQGRSFLFEGVLIGSGHDGEYAIAVMMPGYAAHVPDGLLDHLQDKGDALHLFVIGDFMCMDNIHNLEEVVQMSGAMANLLLNSPLPTMKGSPHLIKRC